MLGTNYDNKKNFLLNPLFGNKLKKELDFVPRTGFITGTRRGVSCQQSAGIETGP